MLPGRRRIRPLGRVERDVREISTCRIEGFPPVAGVAVGLIERQRKPGRPALEKHLDGARWNSWAAPVAAIPRAAGGGLSRDVLSRVA